MPPKKTIKERVVPKRKEGEGEADMAGEEPARAEAGAELQEGTGGREQAAASTIQVRTTQASTQATASIVPSIAQATTSIVPGTAQAIAEAEATATQGAEMEAMHQNMIRLQDTLSQMQEQHQVYEAALQAKTTLSTSASPNPSSTPATAAQAIQASTAIAQANQASTPLLLLFCKFYFFVNKPILL
uniref:Uncharacterized protein n=3 Tax=Oryza TaxID=4527 RepID=Q6AUF0_ORYSJ|nr:hypothetical protein [Oryza sativa Japonica Group]ABF97817.1 hypothetical protein LOC_Os03g43830 [Oryza sativa Japonica Group]